MGWERAHTMQVKEELLLFSDVAMLLHQPGQGHPESPERLASLQRAFTERPVSGARWCSPSMAAPEDLLRVHAASYVEGMLTRRGESLQLDADTRVSPGSIDAALLAAGAAIEAVRAAFETPAGATMAFVRPPGHHAERRRPMGFCLFNNVAIAAEYALAHLPCERVLIIDWDVHHGNGTQHAFEGRSDVLFFSAHQFPFYPGTGALREVGYDAGHGYTVNVPMEAGAHDGDYALIFEQLLTPIAEHYAPDLVIVSAGFDAHRLDPLGGMRLSDEGFAHMMGVVRDIARRCASGRLALVLEGGYDLSALEEGVRACLEVAAGRTPPQGPMASVSGEEMLRRALEVHRTFWPL